LPQVEPKLFVDLAGQEAGCATIFVDHGCEADRPIKADTGVCSFAEESKVILLARGN
jgi:hypothetical protein